MMKEFLAKKNNVVSKNRVLTKCDNPQPYARFKFPESTFLSTFANLTAFQCQLHFLHGNQLENNRIINRKLSRVFYE